MGWDRWVVLAALDEPAVTAGEEVGFDEFDPDGPFEVGFGVEDGKDEEAAEEETVAGDDALLGEELALGMLRGLVGPEGGAGDVEREGEALERGAAGGAVPGLVHGAAAFHMKRLRVYVFRPISGHSSYIAHDGRCST